MVLWILDAKIHSSCEKQAKRMVKPRPVTGNRDEFRGGADSVGPDMRALQHVGNSLVSPLSATAVCTLKAKHDCAPQVSTTNGFEIRHMRMPKKHHRRGTHACCGMTSRKRAGDLKPPVTQELLGSNATDNFAALCVSINPPGGRPCTLEPDMKKSL